MFQNTSADLRADILQVVEEAPDRNKGLICLQLLPKQNVKTREGLYPRFTPKDTGLFQARSEQRAPGGRYPRTTRSYTYDRYTTADWGLEEAIDDTEKADLIRYFDMETTTAQFLRDEVYRTHEIKVAEKLLVEGNPEAATPTGFHTMDATSEYTEAGLSSLYFAKDVEDVMNYMEGKGYVPNTVVITRSMLNMINRSPKMISYFYPVAAGTGEPRPITMDDIKRKFGFENLLVPTARYDTSKKRGTVTRTQIWSDNYIVFAQVAGGDFKNGGLGRTLAWDEFSGDRLWNSMSYREEQTKSDILRCSAYFGEHVVDYNAAVLLKLNP